MTGAAHTRTRIVQSRANARVKQLRAALAHPGREQLVGLEGAHLVEEALRSESVDVETVFVRQGSEAELDRLPQAALNRVPEVLAVSADALRSAASTDTPQGLAALARAPHWALEDVFTGEPLILVLDGVQDPGNVGTLVRSAEAFGATGVLALRGTANVWNPKALRASMGSLFRLPVLSLSMGEAIRALQEHRVRSFAAVARGGCALEEAQLTGPLALLVGSEGAGLSPELLGAASELVTLTYPGPVESLNAAVAGSLLMYACAQQRAAREPRPR